MKSLAFAQEYKTEAGLAGRQAHNINVALGHHPQNTIT